MEPIKLRTHVFKGCQRCGGDLRLERSADVPFGGAQYEYTCLQCGRSTSLRQFLQRMQQTQKPVAA